MSELKRQLEIENLANQARLNVTVYDALPVPMNTVASRIGDIRPARRIHLVVKPDDEMGSDDAYTDTTKATIYLRESTFKDLAVSSRARFTLAHEIGHAMLHNRDGALSRSMSGKDARTQAGTFGVAKLESEANQFASAFLMPREKVDLNASNSEISQQFGVTEKTAEVRKRFLNELNRRELGQKRKLTPTMILSLAKLGISTKKFE